MTGAVAAAAVSRGYRIRLSVEHQQDNIDAVVRGLRGGQGGEHSRHGAIDDAKGTCDIGSF